MIRLLILLSILLGLSGCASVLIDHVSVPAEHVETANVENFETARSWADELSPQFMESAANLRLQQARKSGVAQGYIDVLTLSGGGSNGAFGAGLLVGWTDRGDRPQFEVVSGVSTGALIAPLAFLGPDYDDELKEFYTTISTRDILNKQIIGGLLGGAALASSKPLAQKLAEVITPEFLEEIAVEHEKGRRLVVITTNIEAQRGVIWDLGQIATRRSPEALELFRSIILASASIPGAFPPVPVEVVVDGQTYTELHVDGGTATNVFLAPVDALSPARREGRLYVIRNGKLRPEFTTLESPTALKIAGRAIATMSKHSVNADVERLQILAKRNVSDFQIVSIPLSFTKESKEPFDREYMNALYELGYAAGISGDLWTRDPRVLF